MRSLTEPPKRQKQNNAPFRFQSQSSSEPERCVLKQKGSKTPNTKFGERPVLFLEVKIDNAVGEVPKKGQNKNWRASCAVFTGENRVGGRVCEALARLSDPSVAAPRA
jgi:hypothetical protein